MKEISLLSLPQAGRFARGFFNRTDVRPPPHTYRTGWTPDGSAVLAGWRWRGSGSAGISRQRRAWSGGVAGVSVAWLQFFRWDHAEHQGEGLPHFQRLPAMDGQHFRPAGLAGWTG